ncbi:hypothetical protein MVEN_00730400 [Mycena venus]|uniref:Uncharacterized protein n=1 Tax=Mycena venus TaxID=2733690 RepID=A0A8H7D5F8_9AGAR|nr:hypothetical protein MVEN_00730400 [Mycena venus]
MFHAETQRTPPVRLDRLAVSKCWDFRQAFAEISALSKGQEDNVLKRKGDMRVGTVKRRCVKRWTELKLSYYILISRTSISDALVPPELENSLNFCPLGSSTAKKGECCSA